MILFWGGYIGISFSIIFLFLGRKDTQLVKERLDSVATTVSSVKGAGVPSTPSYVSLYSEGGQELPDLLFLCSALRGIMVYLPSHQSHVFRRWSDVGASLL